MTLNIFRLQRELRETRAALELANVALRMYNSLHGAGPPGQANCDGPWQSRFAELDEAHEKLHKENQALFMEAWEANTELKLTKKLLADLILATRPVETPVDTGPRLGG